MDCKRCDAVNPGAQGERRFTLIEMLVVVAIIAILAALLAPSLQKALGKARDLSCLNNVRQIGVAAQAYVGDSDNRMPPDKDGKPNNWRWQRYLAPYCGINVDDSSESFAESHPGGTKRGKGVLSCPAMSDSFLTTVLSGYHGNSLKNFKFDYGLNEHLAGNHLPTLSRVKRTGRTFAFLDMSSDDGTGQPSSSGHLYSWNGCQYKKHTPAYPTGSDGKPTAPWNGWFMYSKALPRHGDQKTINIAYADGHAAAWLMPVPVPDDGAWKNASGWKYIGGGDVPNTCQEQDFKAGIWFEK